MACVAYGDATPFPGSAAAVPVVGSALVLLAGAGGHAAAAAAGPRPRRAADAGGGGLVVLAVPLALAGADHRRAPGGADLGFWRTALCVVVVFVLSALTYRFVEQPFRQPRRFPVRRALTLYPAAVALVAAGALGGHYYSEYSSGALGDNPAITLTNFGVKDPSKFDLDKDPTVALVQASVIAARHHMAIPSKLEPDILTVRDDEPDLGDVQLREGLAGAVPARRPRRGPLDRGLRQQPRPDVDPRLRRDRRGARLPHLLLREAELRRLAGHRRRAGPRVAAVAGVRRLPRRGRSTRSPRSTPPSWWSPSSGPNPVLYDDDGNRIPKDGVDAAAREGYVDLFTRLADHRPAHGPAPRRTEVRGPARRVPDQEGQRPRRLPVHAAARLGQRRRHLRGRPPTRPAPRSSTPRSGSAGTARAPR